MSPAELPKIVCICGPTASGKTGFGIALAERVGGEIINADSLQIYRYLDIGTAKPTDEERRRVPHHLINIRTPREPFNAALFKDLADEAIELVRSRGRIPIVVGGTGLYIRILVRGIFEAPKPDEDLRRRLRQEIDAYGVEYLFNRLRLTDPVLAAKVEPHDRNRIMRGLEIFEQTGIPLSEHQQVHDYGESSYDLLEIGIKQDRAELYRRIEMRAHQMIEAGLLEEYCDLRRQDFPRDLKPLMSLGYKQMGAFEAGETSFDEAVADIIRETKRYAKRQITWFRKDPDLKWLDSPAEKLNNVAADVERFMAGEPLVLDWVSDPP